MSGKNKLKINSNCKIIIYDNIKIRCYSVKIFKNSLLLLRFMLYLSSTVAMFMETPTFTLLW